MGKINWIFGALIVGFFTYIVVNGSLGKYIQLMTGQTTVAATPVVGVANVGGSIAAGTPAGAGLGSSPGPAGAIGIAQGNAPSNVFQHFMNGILP